MSFVSAIEPISKGSPKGKSGSSRSTPHAVSAALHRLPSSRGSTTGLPLSPTSFNDVRKAGAYVARDHGFLVRITKEALTPGSFLGVSITSEKPLILLRISNDPWVPLAMARRLAAEADLLVAF